FRRTMTIAGDRVPVMLCSAASDDRTARELTTLPGDLGGLPTITPPYVSEVTEGQIISFLQEMAPLSKTGILVYNAPGIGGTRAPGTIAQLAETDGGDGVKQGDLTPAVVDRIANVLSGCMRLFCGSDLAFCGPLIANFDGSSSA